MMDRFIWGKVSRISPEAPVPVVLVERETILLGGAANVVNNIRSLGGHVSLCGVIGEDEMGQRVLTELTEKGVDIQGIKIEEGRQTTTKTRIIAHQQQLVRIDRETGDSLKPSTFRDFSRYIDGHIENFDGIILSDYGKGLLTKEGITDCHPSGRRNKEICDGRSEDEEFFLLPGSDGGHPEYRRGKSGGGDSHHGSFFIKSGWKGPVEAIAMRGPCHHSRRRGDGPF